MKEKVTNFERTHDKTKKSRGERQNIFNCSSMELFHMTSRHGGHIGVQNNETAAMLVFRENALGIEFF